MSLVADIGRLLPTIFIAFAASAIFALVLTPFVRRFSTRFGLIDRPDSRRVNTRPIPRAGGIAVVAAFLSVAIVVVVLADRRLIGSIAIPASVVSQELGALLIGGLVAAAIGFLDDALQIRARWQLLGQVGVALFAVALGVRIDGIANPLAGGLINFPDLVAVAITMLWIVGMINSINFIDGLDGLSSGIALIAAVTLGLISLTTAVGPLGQPFVAVLCFVLAGSLLGFLRWNFHPATIFVGTSGVMFIGYTLAVLSILGSAKVAVALLVLGVPVIDTFWIIVRRIASGRSPFTPDRGHVHHRLLDLGLSHTQTVIVIYGISIAFASLTFILSGAGQLYAFVGVVLASGLILLVLTGREVSADLESDSYDGPVVLDSARPRPAPQERPND